MDLERYLKRYLEMGWSVIPMAPGSKVPTRGISWSHYVSKGVTKEDWERWRLLDLLPSGHGLALICGKTSGVVVIDADDAEAAAQVRAELFCPEVITARGAHFYLCYDPRLRNGPLEVPGIGRIEIKSDGSLTTLPPSHHPSGHRYSWALEPWEIELPKVPDWLIEAQRERERREKLKGQIAVVGFPKKDSKRRLTPEILRALLEQAGVRIKNQRTFNGREFWPLRTCPICGKSEGSPWVWADTGRLVCFRATCEASKFNGGLSLRAWLAKLGLQDLFSELEPSEDPEEQEIPPPVSLDEARSRITEALRAKGDLFLAVPPGVGKSTLTLRWACHEASQPVLYSTPTHALAKELAAKARELGTLAQVIKGRSPETCLKFSEVETCRRRGFDPGQVLCPFCEHHLENPQMAEKCLFWRQFEAIKRDEGLYFCSHLLAAYLLSHELRKATTWIVDEQPLQLLPEVEFSAEGLRSLRAIFPETSSVMKLIEEVLKVADALHREVATARRRVQGRLYPKPPQVGPWKNRAGLFELLDIDPIIEGPKILKEIQETLNTYKPRKLFELGVNFHAIKWIRELFSSGACHLAVTKDPKKPIVCRYSANLVPSNWAKRLVILDATGNINVFCKLFRRSTIEEVNVYVPVEGRKIFVRDRITKSSLQKGKIKSEDLKKALEVAFKRFPSGARVILFAHQVGLKRVQAVVKALRPDLEVVFTHHFGSKTRGVNVFEDFDGVVVFGLPLKNPEQFYQTAQALGLSQEEFQNWVAVESKAELLQELHRIRPVLKPGKTLVVVGRDWPLGQSLGSPDEVIDLTPLGKKTSTAVSILLAWLEVFGFVLIEIALLLGIGLREQIPPEEQRTQVLVTVGERFPTKLAKFLEKIEPFSLIKATNPLIEKKEKKGNGEKLPKGVGSSLYNILIRDHQPLVQTSKSLSVLPKTLERDWHSLIRLKAEFKNRKWWSELLRRLRKARPDLSIFEVRLQTPGGPQWSRGLGNIKAAQAFYQALGREIDPNAWREVG